LNNSTVQKIQLEIEQIDTLLSEAEPLLKLCKLKTPDFIERSAAALLLHSFYNGLENILSIIMKETDQKLPDGLKWHKELLDTAFTANAKRSEIFRKELQEILSEYLAFRHFLRHTYGFKISWARMENPVNNLESVWLSLKEDIARFIKRN